MLLVRVVKAFILDWRQIAEAGVEPLEIVHVVDEAAKLSFGIGKRLVLVGPPVEMEQQILIVDNV